MFHIIIQWEGKENKKYARSKMQYGLFLKADFDSLEEALEGFEYYKKELKKDKQAVLKSFCITKKIMTTYMLVLTDDEENILKVY